VEMRLEVRKMRMQDQIHEITPVRGVYEFMERILNDLLSLHEILKMIFE
jgi:hypothetical protein